MAIRCTEEGNNCSTTSIFYVEGKKKLAANLTFQRRTPFLSSMTCTLLLRRTTDEK
jgi:hypothetical protein